VTQQSFQFDDAGIAAEVDDATAGANGSGSTAAEVNGAESTAAEATEAEVAEVAVPETLSIGEAIRAVNEAISSGVGGLVWVRGELHNTKIAKGHRYFDLVDDAAGNKDVRQRPKVSAQLFANAFQRIQPRLDRAGVKLAEGLCVRMRGTFEVYALSGRFNFRVVDVDPEFTLGNLAMQRDALMRSLAADGVLDANSSRPMPLVPLRIGVVASGGSEGWHDFRTNLEESGLAFVVELAHARVQGAGAPMQVARAIRGLAGRSDIDVVAVVRGGGSKSDLATFDHEFVARAIAACDLPVITGIGHDNDRSVADEVAHTACKTPTACAQVVIDRVRAFQHEVDRRANELGHRVAGRLAACDRAVAARAETARRLAQRAVSGSVRGLAVRRRQLGAGARRNLGRADSALTARHRTITGSAQRTLRDRGRRVDRLDAALRLAAPRALAAATARVAMVGARVDAVDPAVALARGWSITTTADGRLVRSIADVAPGETLATRVRDGEVRSTVTDVHEPDDARPPVPARGGDDG